MAQSQLVRFWHHDDKWDATRGTFMFYIGRLRHEAEQQYQAHKEKSAISKIKERAAKFFTIMYNRRLNSGAAFREDPDVKRIMKNIKKNMKDPKMKPGPHQEQKQLLILVPINPPHLVRILGKR